MVGNIESRSVETSVTLDKEKIREFRGITKTADHNLDNGGLKIQEEYFRNLARDEPNELRSKLYEDFTSLQCLAALSAAWAHCDAGEATPGCQLTIPARLSLPRETKSLRSSTDSDLEAFNHNPTDGSFAPLPVQASAWASCLNLRFLSYWAELLLQQPFNSRVKLTCLTTV